MNFFLLLKNELSLNFLRQTENIVQTVKLALRVYASEDEKNRLHEESAELRLLEKILKGLPTELESDDEEEEKKHKGDSDGETTPSQMQDDKTIFQKVVQKLLEYNERINSGKEIAVTEYFKRIDQRSEWLKKYVNQRHLRRSFFEEYKIHSLNYILLLFESVVRMLTTMNKDVDEDEPLAKGTKRNKDGEKESQQYYYSKNYKRFLEHRAKKLDNFVINCIGWSHVLRCIEVIEMALRDLVYKIVPTKVVVRELKTTSGKVLTKDSEYTLVERKKYVQVGKKTQIDYVFELDIKETDQDQQTLEAKQAKEAQEA